MGDISVRPYTARDVRRMTAIWNAVVEDGVAFPQTDALTEETGAAFFAAQSKCGVACDGASGDVIGMYILHPNNVGRCGHIANASYAVDRAARGRGVGRLLVEDSLTSAKAMGFRIMQFNAVVEDNLNARRLYESLGFTPLGVIPEGFLLKSGVYDGIVPYYKVL